MSWLLKRDDTPAAAEAPPAPPAPAHPLLAGLGAEQAAAVHEAGQVRKYTAGDVLLQAGTPDGTLYLVLEGEVGMLSPQSADHGHLGLAGTVGPGGCLGGPSHPAQGSRDADAVARGPVTCLQLGPEAFDKLEPATQVTLLKGLAAVTARLGDAILADRARLAGRSLLVARRARLLLEQRQAVCANSEMVRKIVASVPALPMYASRLAMLLHEADASAADVVNLAKLDPSLAGVVLKTVNSPYYNLQNKVTDLQHAVVLLGFDQVYQIVMSSGLASTMPNTAEFRELQMHANAVSFIAMELARLAGMERPATLATLGLLHDIGMSVVLLLKEQFPNLAVFLGMLDAGKLGSMLLERWQLPPDFCQAVLLQRHPEFLPPSELPEACRAQTAGLYLAHLCYDHLRGRKEHELPSIFLPEYMEAAGLKGLSLGSLVGRKLMPALATRRGNFPEPMRRFFAECESRLPAV